MGQLVRENKVTNLTFAATGGKIAILGAAVLALSACVAPRVAQTDFQSGSGQSQETVSNWALAGVTVTVPEEMIVTNEPDRRYPPAEHLVWYGDPPGDRKAQVSQLMAEAAQAGALDALNGSTPVNLRLTIDQFHAMTPKARATSLQLGVHEIQFDIEVVDANSGAVVASEENINADLRAFSGDEAIRAEQIGQGQKIRIQSRVAEVVRAWLLASGA